MGESGEKRPEPANLPPNPVGEVLEIFTGKKIPDEPKETRDDETDD